MTVGTLGVLQTGSLSCWLCGQVIVGNTLCSCTAPLLCPYLTNWLPLPKGKNGKAEAPSPGVLWKPRWNYSDPGAWSGAQKKASTQWTTHTQHQSFQQLLPKNNKGFRKVLLGWLIKYTTHYETDWCQDKNYVLTTGYHLENLVKKYLSDVLPLWRTCSNTTRGSAST